MVPCQWYPPLTWSANPPGPLPIPGPRPPLPALCSQEQQGQLLAGVRRVLGSSAFRFSPPWARIISGADEGVYGWIALNYLEGESACASVVAACWTAPSLSQLLLLLWVAG